MPAKRPYILTETAEKDFRAAKAWSIKRWGKSLTSKYFLALDAAARHIADCSPASEEYGGLGVYPVKEHYLVYLSQTDKPLIIVALIRQTRDVPAILEANKYRLLREVRAVVGNK